MSWIRSLFRQLKAEFAAWKAGADREWEEMMEASRQARELKPEFESARVASPQEDRDALVLRNSAKRVFISVVHRGGRIHEAQPVLILQHCLDLDSVRVEWVDSQRIAVENQCNEFSIVSPAEIESNDEHGMILLLR
jgi:hypothetical protein